LDKALVGIRKIQRPSITSNVLKSTAVFDGYEWNLNQSPSFSKVLST